MILIPGENGLFGYVWPQLLKLFLFFKKQVCGCVFNSKKPREHKETQFWEELLCFLEQVLKPREHHFGAHENCSSMKNMFFVFSVFFKIKKYREPNMFSLIFLFF